MLAKTNQKLFTVKMGFDKLSVFFKNTIIEILDSSRFIEENHVKNVASILKKYAELNIKSNQTKLFLNNVLLYFILLNKYAKQFTDISASQHCMVRTALDVFVFVVDTTQIYQIIIRTFRKIVDVNVESNPKNSNIKEYLRVYSHMLDKVPVEILQKLAVKHKAYETLSTILKETGDIETQAVIIDVICKLFKNNRFLEVDTFQDLMQFFDTNTNEINMYQKIRMILDHLNEFSANIFSINCNTIQLDSNRVLEFCGAGSADDIWLDVNVLQNKLSFFCDNNFASSVGKVKFYSSTGWEVLSFCTKDVLKIVFNYNTVAENLNILMELNTSSLSFLTNVKVDSVRTLAISISRYSDRFYKLVEIILPKIFAKSFSAELLNIPKKENDSSKTSSDLLKNNSADDSSPVIEHFSVLKKVSTREITSPITVSDSIHSDSDSVVLISDNENDELLPQKQSTKIAVFNGNLNSHISTFISSNTSTCKKNNSERIKISKIKSKSFIDKSCEQNGLNKSVSPLSFTESVFARSVRPSSRNSKCSHENVSLRHGKISMLDEKLDHNRNYKKKKISAFKRIPKKKISASVSSPIIKNTKRKKRGKKWKDEKSISTPDEKALDNNLLDDDLNCSKSKVENWLKKVDLDNVATIEIDNEIVHEIPSLHERPDSLIDLPSVSIRNTGRSSNLAPEERLELLMRENDERAKDQENILTLSHINDVGHNQSTSVADLLKILTSDDIAETMEHNVTDGRIIDLEKPDDNDLNCTVNSKKARTQKEKFNSQDSNQPLSELAVRWKLSYNKNAEGVDKNLQHSSPVNVLRVEDELSMNHTNEGTVETQVVQLNEVNAEKENQIVVVDLEDLEDKSDDDVTPDLNINPEIPETSVGTEESLHYISVLPDTANARPKSTKKKLYTEGDLSYLNGTITEEYLKSRDDKEVIVIKSSGRPAGAKRESRERKPRVQTKNTKTKKKTNKNQVDSKSRLNLTKSDLVSRNTSKTKTDGTFTKAFNSLKQKLRDAKKENKRKKRLSNKKKGVSSSSSSSMVPFGEALNHVKKRKSTSLDNTKDAKRQKEVNKNNNEGLNQKIRIISNVLIQPGSCSLSPQQQSQESNFCDTLVRKTNQYYLEFIKCVEQNKPNLLANDNCSAIVNILQGCANRS